METFRHELEKRPIFKRLQLRLLARLARRRSDKILCFRWNSIIRECFRDLVEEPLIDRSAQWHEVRALISEERLAKKLAHLSVDFAWSEIVIIEKNLKSCCGFLVIVRQGHQRLRRFRRSSFWNCRCGRRAGLRKSSH